MKLLQTEKAINNSFALEIGFKCWHCVIVIGGKLVPKYLGDDF
jgi:hypothetical protein